MGFIGSIVGLWIIYLMPVLTYLKKIKGELDCLQVAEANEIYRESENKRLYSDSEEDNSSPVSNKMFNYVLNGFSPLNDQN